MAREFRLQALGESIAEAEIVAWMVEVGDRVEIDQTLCEVETDKSVIEVPSPFAGVISERHFEVGDTVEVGQLLVMIAEADGKVATVVEDVSVRRPVAATPIGNPLHRVREKAGLGEASGDLLALPKVRKLARERAIDLTTLVGRGPNGEISVEDVEGAAAVAAPEQPISPPPKSAAPSRPRGDHPEQDLDRVRMSKLRRTISDHMTRSWTQTPMITGFSDAECGDFLDTRKALSVRLGKAVPVEALLIRMIVPVLREFPELNATIEGEDVVYHRRYHVGVAIDTTDGLLVPVVRDADRLSVGDLVDEVTRLMAGARDRSLPPDDLRGQTFTVSNIGAVGGFHSVSILPEGTTGFVSVGRARPVVKMRNGGPVEVPVLPLSLTCDHRVVDGAPAARFMSRMVENFEHPFLAVAE
jgi:pyruvate dehydrogenase E2 component (dihydrolipoamide acetyltransferase)